MNNTAVAANETLEKIDEIELAELAKELIRIPSQTGDEGPLARWLYDYFKARDYEVELQELGPGRCQTIATLRGTGGGLSLMFNGHIDIDPLDMGWTRDPFDPQVVDGWLYGAGVINMKGSDAAMIHAVEAIRKTGRRPKGDIVIAMVAGELEGGYGTQEMLRRGVRTDMAIVGEPFGSPHVLTMNAGTMTAAITVIGRSEHSMYRDQAVDALQKMLKVVPAIDRMTLRHTPRPDIPGLPRVHVGAIIGGRGRDYDLRGSNYVSDVCSILVDFRLLPGQTIDMVEEDIHATLRTLQDQDPELEFTVQVPPQAPLGSYSSRGHEPFEISTNAYIVQSVAQNYTRISGKEPETLGIHIPGAYSGDDTSHLWQAGIPCVLYGPAVPGSIRSAIADEALPVEELVTVAKVYVLTALDICNLTELPSNAVG